MDDHATRRPRKTRTSLGHAVLVDVSGRVSVARWAGDDVTGSVSDRIRALLGCATVDRLDGLRVARTPVSVHVDADAVLDGLDPNTAVSVTTATAIHGPAVIVASWQRTGPVGLTVAAATHIAGAFTRHPPHRTTW